MIFPIRKYDPPRTNPLLRHIDLIESSDTELAIEAFKQASRAADDMNMELVGEFTYTGKRQKIHIMVEKIKRK